MLLGSYVISVERCCTVSLNRSLALFFSCQCESEAGRHGGLFWSLRFGLKWSESVGGWHVTAASQAEH